MGVMLKFMKISSINVRVDDNGNDDVYRVGFLTIWQNLSSFIHIHIMCFDINLPIIFPTSSSSQRISKY